MRIDQHRACSHFGLGAARLDLTAMGDDPRGWLEMQLQHADARPMPRVPPSHETMAASSAAATERRRAQRNADGDPQRVAEVEQLQQAFRRQTRQSISSQAATRFRHGVATTTPFRERLVMFWSNHFTVSRQGRPQLVGSCTAYENEAIRASLDGHFEDLLLAAVSHPAMLLYLDNAQSMGPESRVGRRRKTGLNENLAREILELHTLGVDGGYRQEDVKALAGMLTGWTVGNDRLKRAGAEPGKFAFVAPMHQPGGFEMLGRRYREGGVEQARSALRELARHPSTARFVCTKLARHFVADTPPADAVDTLVKTFHETEGHLPSLHRAVVGLSAAWDVANRKLKSPYEFMVSVHRGLELDLDQPQVVLNPLRLMNQFPFSAPSPAGWPDTNERWGAPAALKQRIEWSVAFARRGANRVKVRDVSEWLVPPTGSKRLEVSLERAESPAQALGLLLASPDFQWR